MTTINLLWPSWADVVAHVRKKDVVSWKTIRKAAALLANRYGREQDARFARLAWEELEAARKTAARELWARPPHRIRFVRHFLALALALALSSTAAPAAADRKTEEIALVVASAADIVTTELWLSHDQFTIDGVTYRPIETGAVLQHIESPAGRIAVKAAGTAAFLYFARFMERRGRPRAASLIRLSGVTVWATGAGWNVGLIVRH